MVAQLPYIWRTVAPLKKEQARASMEAACQRNADSLRFRPSRIPHPVAVIVMALAIHTEDPDGVGDALNIYFYQTSFPWQGRRRHL